MLEKVNWTNIIDSYLSFPLPEALPFPALTILAPVKLWE